MTNSKIEFWKIICRFLIPNSRSFIDKIEAFEAIHHHRDFKNTITLQRKEKKYFHLTNQKINDIVNIDYFEDELKQNIKIENKKLKIDKSNFNMDSFPREFIPIIESVIKAYQLLFDKEILAVDETKNIHFTNKVKKDNESPLEIIYEEKDPPKEQKFSVHWLGCEINISNEDIETLFSMNFSYAQKKDILNNICDLPSIFLPIIEQYKSKIIEKSIKIKENKKENNNIKLFVDWLGEIYIY
ncbi:hypothetical protein [Mycoplasma sp. SG1]|uniref:hypothetical protein n=1 Tax=Mycoplasma sp. SG1 TaxID=2810348 RepID=UPI002024C46D|nr:hypothetical protein [Mycoplasma sp. SG1]URM53240.1 hypothetical protein JRW51_02740 [Mycoplasma sp. SG1]